LEYIAELFFFVGGLHSEMMNLAESLLVTKKILLRYFIGNWIKGLSLWK